MEDVENQLKELILDEDFTNLQNLASEEVNLMEILGIAKKELPKIEQIFRNELELCNINF